MTSDDLQIMQALSGPQEWLSREDRDVLLEYLVQLRTGRELTGTQRKRLEEICDKARERARSAKVG